MSYRNQRQGSEFGLVSNQDRPTPKKNSMSQSSQKSTLSRLKAFLTPDKRTTLVIATVGMTHGLLYSYDTVFSYIYRDDFRFSPAQSSFVDACNQFAWMIKPVFGAISDNFRLFGYRRKSYLILTAILCWICILNFGLWVPPVGLALGILLIHNVSMSFENCMAEAVLVQNTQGANRKHGMTEHQKVKTASRGVSTWFGSQYIGKITGGLLVMCFLQEDYRRSYLFWGSFVPLAGATAALLLPEKRAKKEEEQQAQIQAEEDIKSIEIELSENIKKPRKSPQTSDEERLKNQALLEGKPQTEGDTIKTDEIDYSEEIDRQSPSKKNDNQRLIRQNPPPSQDNMSNLQKTIQFLKNPLIFKAVLLVFLNGIAPQSPQTKFYFYTSELEFDSTFIGTLKFISYVAVFLGVLVYDRYLRNINLRIFYSGTAIIGCLIALSQLILIFRINVQLGIPDKLFAALDTFILELFLQFHGLPILVLACRICPKNIEATIFGLLMSVCSMAYMISLQLGALLTHLLGITSANFDNLWILILTTSVFYLVPLTILQMIQFEDAMKQEAPEAAGAAEAAEISIHEQSVHEVV